MFNFCSLASLAVIAGLAIISAAQRHGPRQFNLMTRVLSGDLTKDGLYGIQQTASGMSQSNNITVEAYHTGAGESDATLTSNITFAAPGILNGTSQEFLLNGPYIYGLYNAVRVEYTLWYLYTHRYSPPLGPNC